jgi:hypothetical protein
MRAHCWPGSKMNGMPSVRRCVPDHRVRIVRRDDREPAVAHGAKRKLTRVRHGAGVERRNLIVLDVGAAEERRAELPVHLPGMTIEILGPSRG